MHDFLEYHTVITIMIYLIHYFNFHSQAGHICRSAPQLPHPCTTTSHCMSLLYAPSKRKPQRIGPTNHSPPRVPPIVTITHMHQPGKSHVSVLSTSLSRSSHFLAIFSRHAYVNSVYITRSLSFLHLLISIIYLITGRHI